MRAPIVITNVTLVNGIDAPKCVDVPMAGGHIADITRPNELAAVEETRINGEGQFFVPRLWESHTHMMLGSTGVLTTRCRALNEASSSICRVVSQALLMSVAPRM